MSHFFNKIFNSTSQSERGEYIEIAHGKSRYHIPFPPDSIQKTATVGDLRVSCVELTHCPAEQIGLLFRGKSLVDNGELLKNVGMKSGSKVLCMASKHNHHGSTHNKTVDGEPRSKSLGNSGPGGSSKPVRVKVSPLEALDTLMITIREELEPGVIEFTAHPPLDIKRRREEHDRLAELLLQKLFALDGIHTPEEIAEAEKEVLRNKRKDGVRFAQGLLDRVDGIVKGDELPHESEEVEPELKINSEL